MTTQALRQLSNLDGEQVIGNDKKLAFYYSSLFRRQFLLAKSVFSEQQSRFCPILGGCKSALSACEMADIDRRIGWYFNAWVRAIGYCLFADLCLSVI